MNEDSQVSSPFLLLWDVSGKPQDYNKSCGYGPSNFTRQEIPYQFQMIGHANGRLIWLIKYSVRSKVGDGFNCRSRILEFKYKYSAGSCEILGIVQDKDARVQSFLSRFFHKDI